MYYLSRLRDLRQDHDLKQKEVAALLKIDQRVYSTYETGKREIPLRHLVFLAQYFFCKNKYISKSHVNSGIMLHFPKI